MADANQDRVVELHRVTMEFRDKAANMLYQAFTQKHLTSQTTNIDIYGKSVAVPSNAYNVLYVFMHVWHHFESSGVGFRQLGDWALCLKLAHQQSSTDEWQALTWEIDQMLTAMRMKVAWQTFGHILVDELQLPVEAFPLYTTDYKRRAKRLLSQLLRDGHCGRPVKGSVCLMRSFAWERPKSNRILQVSYTACRLVFKAWQMSKFFPDLAWHEIKVLIKHMTGCQVQ